jgi:hypothetical protein
MPILATHAWVWQDPRCGFGETHRGFCQTQAGVFWCFSLWVDLLFLSHFNFFTIGDVSRWDWRLQKAPFADGSDLRGSHYKYIDS